MGQPDAPVVEPRELATAVAHATPLPGPLLEAFAQPALRAAGLTFAPLTAYHLVLLQQIDAPIIRKMQAAAEWRARQEGGETADEPQITSEVEAIYEQIFLLTRPSREGRAALAAGRAAFREAALAAVADTLPADPRVLAGVVEAAELHFVRAMSTRVEYGAPVEGQGEVFTTQPALPTGSVGGSATSARLSATTPSPSTPSSTNSP